VSCPIGGRKTSTAGVELWVRRHPLKWKAVLRACENIGTSR
jgi:hypothetical protein